MRDEIPVTEQEEAAWREMERRQATKHQDDLAAAIERLIQGGRRLLTISRMAIVRGHGDQTLHDEARHAWNVLVAQVRNRLEASSVQNATVLGYSTRAGDPCVDPVAMYAQPPSGQSAADQIAQSPRPLPGIYRNVREAYAAGFEDARATALSILRAQPAAATPDEIEGLRAHVPLLKSALAQSERENDELRRAQPAAATVPADEREAFEAWARTQADSWLIVGGLTWSPGTGDYASARTNAAWASWQARAALAAAQPAASAEPVAWRWKWEGYPWTYSDDPKPSPPMKGMIREPLYAAPVAAQAPQEPDEPLPPPGIHAAVHYAGWLRREAHRHQEPKASVLRQTARLLDVFKAECARLHQELIDAQAPAAPVHVSDDVRAALLFALWHNQGGSSPVGQPIRAMLGIGQHDHMTKEQYDEAHRVHAALGRSEAPAANGDAPTARELDMAMLIKRLAATLRVAWPESTYMKAADDAMDALNRWGLAGSPLREGGE